MYAVKKLLEAHNFVKTLCSNQMKSTTSKPKQLFNTS